MAVSLSIYVEDISTAIASYNRILLYRDTEPDGTFSTLVGTYTTLVAGTEAYTITDASGTVDYWYRYTLYNSSTADVTANSDPFKPNGSTLLKLIGHAAERAGAGFRSACTSVGTAAKLLDTGLIDNGVDADFLEGAWVLRATAAAANQVRRVNRDGFTTADGGLRPTRDWTVVPASAEAYYIFRLLPPIRQAGQPYTWTDAARDAFNMLQFEDELNLGEGLTTAQTRFALTTHLGYLREHDVRYVMLRTTDGNGIITDQDASKGVERYWETVANGSDLSIDIHPAPSTTQTIIVAINRRYPQLYALDDITLCDLELAARATVYCAYRYLDRRQSGKYRAERMMAADDLAQIYDGFIPQDEVRGG